MGNLAHSARDASTHVAKARGCGHPRGPQTLNLSADTLGHVLAKTRVARVSNRCLDYRRVDPHLASASDSALDGELDDSLEDRAERRTVQQLAKANHRLFIRHLARVD